ncbi:hypothetical protein CF336_g9113 [Tilletia laevis]|nr:hypothetical protein CF336_g9113 [Tilletia laevis]
MVVDAKTSAKAVAKQLKHGEAYDASRSAVYKAKAAILNESYGDEAKSFGRLPAYMEALTTADSDTRAVLESSDGKFKRMFVCPGAARHAWRYCRKWLAIDATFMKTKYQSRLKLAAVMDGTGSLVVLAWCLTDGETLDNWTWFMRNLRDSLDGLDSPASTIVSDRNAGLLSAIDEVLPTTRSTYCCFHIAKNIKEAHHSAAAVRLFWQMVYARTADQFKGHMQRLEEVDKGGANYIKGIDPTKWANYAVPGRRFGHVTSNLVEIANAMVLEARELPPLYCFDFIYRHQMERFFSRRVEAINCDSPIVPAEYIRLQREIVEARRMTAVCSSATAGCVTSVGGTQYVVQLPADQNDMGRCDCRFYQQLLRPCRHAVALLQKLKQSIAPHYHWSYTTTTWREVYSKTLPPINVSALADGDLQPPTFKRKRGRPQKERKEVGSRSSTQHCSVCGRDDHRRRDCNLTWDM